MNKKAIIICTMLPLLAMLIINWANYFAINQKVKEEKASYPYLLDHCIYSVVVAKHSNYHKSEPDKSATKRVKRTLNRNKLYTSVINQLKRDPEGTFPDDKGDHAFLEFRSKNKNVDYPKTVRIYTHDKNKILIYDFNDRGKSPFRHLYYSIENGEFILKDSSLTAYPQNDIKSCDAVFKSNGEPLLAMNYSCMISDHYTYMYCVYDVCKKKIIFNDVRNYDNGDGYGVFFYDKIFSKYNPKDSEEEDEDDDDDDYLRERVMYNNQYTLIPKHIDNYPILQKRQRKTEQKGKSINRSDTVSYYMISETGEYIEFNPEEDGYSKSNLEEEE